MKKNAPFLAVYDLFLLFSILRTGPIVEYYSRIRGSQDENSSKNASVKPLDRREKNNYPHALDKYSYRAHQRQSK